VGFLENVNRAYTLVMEAESALKSSPATMTKVEAREIEMTVANHLRRAAITLDLSQVPETLRQSVAVESVLQLKEIFDRMLLPPLDSVPDVQMVAAARERASTSSSGSAGPVRWRFPNTKIEIVEILEGERQGQFLFSANTVSKISDFYRSIFDLPYRADIHEKVERDYRSPGTSKGFYEHHISTPGYPIPSAHVLGQLIDPLPGWLKTVHGEQTLWQWVGLVLCVLVVVLAAWVAYRVARRLAGRLTSPLDNWIMIVVPIVIAGIVLVFVDFIDHDLNITGDVMIAVLGSGKAIAVAMAAWGVFYFCGAVAETIIASPRIPDEGVNASLLRLGARLAGFLIGAWILIDGLHGLGMDVVPLLAGLGVGGLAIALAARPTMENIIGSFTIFADNPYGVGQRIKVMGQDGIVESIGLRSTKIRLFAGPQTSIPNEKMATAEIENIGRRPYIRRVLNVTITYDMSPEKINRAVEILREILAVPEGPESERTDSTGQLADTAATEGEVEQKPHPNEAINQPDFFPRVYFNDLNADSLNILVLYWYHPPEYWDYLEHAHWVNVQIMERFKAEGIAFAF
jgi:MscS family membrane protein